MAGRVVLGDAAGLLEEYLVVTQRREPFAQLRVVADRTRRAERHEVAGLLELFVVGPECHRKPECRGLERVVDADAETSADVAPGGIAVYRGENAHGVENQHLTRSVPGAGGALRVTQRPAADFPDDAGDASFVHLVRRDDELHLGVVVDQADEQLLVGPPCRSGDEEAAVALESVDDVDALGRAGDLRHAVEARVSGNQHVVESQRCEQLLRLLVLDKEHVEGLERLTPPAPIGAEEDGVAAEDRRDDVGADLAAAEFAQQVEPVLVFDEDGDLGMGDVEEAAGVPRGVERQVEEVVGPFVVLADLVARGGEEGEQDLVFGMRPAQVLDDRASLFEFSERGDVNPDDTCLGVDRLAHASEQIPAAVDPEPGFFMPQGRKADSPGIKNQTEIIKPHR